MLGIVSGSPQRQIKLALAYITRGTSGPRSLYLETWQIKIGAKFTVIISCF